MNLSSPTARTPQNHLTRLRRSAVASSVDHPRLVLGVIAAITLALGLQILKIRVDTDPTHMLPEDFPVRRYNELVDQRFALHRNVIVLGIVREGGMLTVEGIDLVVDLTRQIARLPGVSSSDVVSLATVDDMTASGTDLDIHPLLNQAPAAPPTDLWRARVMANPLLRGQLLSDDGTTTVIYIPVADGANSQAVSERVRALLPARPPTRFMLTGDSVARDKMGSEIWGQMAIFSPLAGLTMCVVLWCAFRSGAQIAAHMAVALVGVLWSMGLFVGLGVPIHIMSSMAPVFLMAISTDTIHIFNEYDFRFHEVKDKRRAIIESLEAVARPVALSDLATAVGFGSLATATIVPIKIFGLMVAFGTLVILMMSFTLVPAALALIAAPRPRVRPEQDQASPRPSQVWLMHLGRVCVRRARPIALIGALVLAGAAFGLARIRVNDNIIHWFKPQSGLRAADRELNQKLRGTATASLVVEGTGEGALEEPATLAFMQGLQAALEKLPQVGHAWSVVDILRRASFVLHGEDPAFDRTPRSRQEAAQLLLLLGMSSRPHDLDKSIDPGRASGLVRLQLRSWDSDVMRDVLAATDGYLAAHPSPFVARVRPAGQAYFNFAWSREVLKGMLESFWIGLGLVLLMLVIERRSLLWGPLMFLPLLATIVVLYGAIGLLGKDFDMAIAVLSTLALGLAIDFSIHFVSRFQARMRATHDLRGSLVWTVARPGQGILLNAALFAVGFSTMLFADLMPYVTVAVLMMAIMLLSAVLSVVLLPGIIFAFRRRLFRDDGSSPEAP